MVDKYFNDQQGINLYQLDDKCYAYIICILKSHSNFLIFFYFFAYFVLKQ